MIKAAIATLAVLAAISATAEAGTRKIKLTVSQLAPDGENVNRYLGNAVYMSDEGWGFVSVPFVLPGDYKTNSTITVKLDYSHEQAGCSLHAGGQGVFRVRKGKPPSDLNLNDPGVGLTSVGGLIFATPSPAGTVASRTFKISKPTEGPILSQKAGDTISMNFFRDGGAAEDTCVSSLAITGATIIYETN
jgi:hypothetical protein